MATVQQLIDWVISQIGYKEGKGNANKYSSMMGRPPESWCADFICAAFKSCNALNLITNSASCTAMYSGRRDREVSKNSTKAGDIVFFDWDRSGDCDHVGYVIAAGGSQVTTVEGNTSSGNSGSQSNGDGVYRRYRTYSQIAHVVRPKYDNAPTPTPSGGNCNVTVKEVSNGSSGIAVKNLQLILNSRGYNCGTADGVFGAKTKSAVIAFQKAKGLGADGIVGTKTWTALFK